MENMILDDVFRTMIEKMSYLAVPLINEIFHKSYPENVKITRLCNEHQETDGMITTASWLVMGKKMYHIEGQSTDDTTMMIHMTEYNLAIAIEEEKQGQRDQIELPRSCVLSVRSPENTRAYQETEVLFPDGQTYTYSIPVVKMESYTINDIFEKKLLILLPFYIIRYEKKRHNLFGSPESFQTLLNECMEIRRNLYRELAEEQYRELIRLTELIIETVDYIFRKEEKIRKIIDGIMEGRALEQDIENAVGYARDFKKGMEEGEARLAGLVNRLIQDQREQEIMSAATDLERRKQLYKEYGL